MTDAQKVAHVLAELRRVAFPDSATDHDAYWNMVEVARDNATDHICDIDEFIKGLIKDIE